MTKRLLTLERVQAVSALRPGGPTRRYGKSAAERLWERVSKRGPEECWEWPETGRNNGYGQIRVDGEAHRAHRVSLVLAAGRSLTPSDVVMHSCDNRPCCNPAHLSVGTTQDNTADMVAKGRQAGPGWGLANRRGRLTDEQVRAIREARDSGETVRSIAQRFGVDGAYVSRVTRGLLRTRS